MKKARPWEHFTLLFAAITGILTGALPIWLAAPTSVNAIVIAAFSGFTGLMSSTLFMKIEYFITYKLLKRHKKDDQ